MEGCSKQRKEKNNNTWYINLYMYKSRLAMKSRINLQQFSHLKFGHLLQASYLGHLTNTLREVFPEGYSNHLC